MVATYSKIAAAVVALGIGFALFPGVRDAPRTGAAQPVTPVSQLGDEEILETLPRLASGTRNALGRARQALFRTPDDVALATSLAREHLEAARRLGDPRELGYAQAALGHWWSNEDAPDEVLRMRGVIRQAQHDFEGGLADLGRLLARRPDDAQAWLVRASIEQVLGRHSQAMESCREVIRLTDHVAAHACVGDLLSLTGDERAYARLRERLASARVSRAEAAWIETVLGEIAVREGLASEAERHFTAALVAGGDLYTRNAYADLLLQQSRGPAVIALLENAGSSDAVLLRLAIASRQVDPSRSREIASELAARFATARALGDRAHLRERARFALEFDPDPRVALELAIENWSLQKEAADARLLAAAARAARRPDVVAALRARVESGRLRDRELARALAATS